MPVSPLESDDPLELGRFRIVGRLGEGGQGIVYLGEDAAGTRVAIKVLKTGADEKARQRLAREMASAQQVAPFCTARVIEASVTGPRPYVVSEYVDGPSLLQRVETYGPLREGDLDRLVVGTATALTAIHAAGIIHRDLKPANVLLGPDGPRVVDFGIARASDSGTSTSLVGTPAYFAPEQLNGHPPAPASDVFAWAATMAFAATGRAPFGKDAIPAVLNRILNQHPDLDGVPEHLLGVLAECLDKDPARRPTARALLVRLVDPEAATPPAPPAPHATSAVGPPVPEAAVTAESPFGPPTGPTTMPRRPRRGRLGLLAAGTLVVVLAVGLGFWLANGSGPAPAAQKTSAPPAAQGTSAPPAAEKSTAPPRTAGGLAVPAELAGTWTGTIVQTHNLLGDNMSSAVKLTLTAGSRDVPIEYAAWGCTETRTLSRISGSDLVFETGTSTDPIACSTIGSLTLTRQGNTLKYHWGTGPSGEVSDGVLHRG